MAWNPTVIKNVDAAYATASEAIRVKMDAGYGFLKALGNRGGLGGNETGGVTLATGGICGT